MEFDKSRVYTALNADELKIGSKVYISDNLDALKECVTDDCNPVTLRGIYGAECRDRFAVLDNNTAFNLAYLVSEPEEKKLKWIDLKVGDIIQRPFYDGYRTAMVVVIDTCSETTKHIGLANTWLDDTEIEDWVKVDWVKVEE